MSASAVSTAAVLLSQNLVALMFLPLAAVYVMYYSIFNKSPKYLLLSLLSLIWGFAIAAVTYLPALFERNYTRLDQIINIAFVNHFVTLKQLVRSPWGYGFDLPGTINDQMSFQIGLIHLLVLALSLFLTLYLLISNSRIVNKVSGSLFLNPGKRIIILNILFTAVLFLAVFFMVQTKYSLILWQNIKSLQIVDIPWRFLGLVALSMAFIGAFVAKSVKPGLIFLLLVLLVLVANRNHLRINQTRELNDNFFDDYRETATQYNEFTPKWRQTDRAPLDFESTKRVEVLSLNATVSNVFSDSRKTSFEVYVPEESAQIRVNKFYFPLTQVILNGEKLPFDITDSQNLDLSKEIDTSGLIKFEVPKGNHKVSVEHRETALRTAADMLSLIAVSLALFFALKNVKI
jgi:hypothetical protein